MRYKWFHNTCLATLVIATLQVSAQNIFPTIQVGHTDRVTCLQYVKGSESLLTTGMDEVMVEWDRETQSQVGVSFGLKSGASCMAYDYDNNISVYGLYNGQVQIYIEGDSIITPNTVFDFSLYVTSVAISHNGKKVAAASADYSLVIYENDSFKRLETEGDVVGLTFSNDNRYLYFGNYSGAIYKLDTRAAQLKNGLEKIYESESNVSDLCVSDDNKWLAFGAAAMGDNGGELTVLSLKNNKVKNTVYDYYPFLGFQVNSIEFLAGKTLIYKNKNEGISTWNFNARKPKELLDKEIAVGFAVSEDNRWCAYSNESSVYQFEIGDVTKQIDFKTDVENPLKFLGVYENTLLVEYPSGVKSWDLVDLKLEMVQEKFYEHDWHHRVYSKDLRFLGIGEDYGNISFAGTFNHSTYNPARLAGVTADKKYYTYLDFKGSLNAYYTRQDTHTYWGGNKSKSWQYTANYANKKINRMVVHPTQNTIALLNNGFDLFYLESEEYRQMTRFVRNSDINLPGLFDPFQNTLLIATSDIRYDSIAYEGKEGYAKEWESYERPLMGSNKKRYLNKKTGVVNIYELDSLTAPFYLIRGDVVSKDADVTAMALDSFNQRIVIGYSDGTLKVLNTSDSGYYLYNYTRLSSGLRDIIVSEDGKFIFTINAYGAIGALNSDLTTYISSLVCASDNEYVAIDVSGYYKRSKNAQNSVIFQQDTNVMRMNQVDALLNKPHKVMAAFGLVDNAKLQLIARLASKTTDNNELAEGPYLSIANEDKIDYVTKKSSVKIKVDVRARTNPLNYMKIWVNGVPLYAPDNWPSAPHHSTWLNEWKIPLKQGENTIRFVAYDADGVGSNERFVNITCVKEYEKPNLYMAVIAVSDYQDSTMNLNFAVKDGRDFAQVYIDEMGKKQIGFPSRFGKIYLDTFFNSGAVRKNIEKWRNKLLKSKPDDYVVLYVAGHGLLDDSLHFWFATHDINFSKPEEKGMSFDNLEDLLVAIPAQQKLFLMDACHSGEVITDEITIDSSFVLPDGSRGSLKGYTYRGVVVEDVDGETINKGELKQELFSNYDSKSGATVISAAAGNSLALESEEWNNGIFTYTILGGLLKRWADANNDGEVSVVELSRYVTKQVKEQTSGMQIPNDRQENIENNFRVW